MMIREGTQTPDVPSLVIMCFLGITYSFGPPKGNLHYIDLVLKPNTAVLPMQFLNHDGYTIFFLNYIVLFLRQLQSIVTMSMPSISLPIQSKINARNTQKWIIFLFRKSSLRPCLCSPCSPMISNYIYLYQMSSFNTVSGYQRQFQCSSTSCLESGGVTE